MNNPTLIDRLEEQVLLNEVADTVQNAVTSVYESAGEAGHKVKNFLHGTWLGHPLHPILTDIPIGAWTTAVAVDTLSSITGNESLESIADAAITFGLLGAVGAAITGITDWKETDAGPRNLGLTHALLNITATMLFAGSLIARKSEARSLGKGLALAGFSIVTLGAYLGGMLVYRDQIGVNHSLGQELSDRFTPICDENELKENKPHRVNFEDKRILLVKQQDIIFAIAEVCSHLGGPLAEGKLEGETIRCPWHGSCFSLRDGSVVDGPATHSQPCYEVRVRKGQVELRSKK